MKILTDSQYKKLIDKVSDESYEIGKAEGFKKGYKNGLHIGLTTDKKRNSHVPNWNI